MNRNIMKKVQESGLKLGKLKLDLSKRPQDNIAKTITYIAKGLNGEDLEMDSLKYALVNTMLYGKGTEFDMRKSENIDLALGKNINYDNYYEFEYDNVDSSVYIKDMRYFDMSGKLPTSKNGNRYIWRDESKGKFTVHNGKKLIAISKLYDEVSKRLSVLDQNMYKGYLRQRFYYGNKYYNDHETNEVILNIILDIYQDDISIQSMKDYEQAQTGDYAKSFMTKKNINKNAMVKMENNKFIGNGFAFVEVDNDTDLAKLELIEKEWVEVYKLLPEVNSTDVDLRFRKLGNHKATGLYYPTQNCICVDIREVSSMIHEYGHLIDYKMYDSALSLSEDFRDIIKAYSKEVDRLPNDSYVVKKRNYYTTPTEIFARGFELYIAERIETSFLKDKKSYTEDDAYKCFNELGREMVDDFFSELFGIKTPNVA